MTIRDAIALGSQTLAEVPDPTLDAIALLSEATGLPPLRLRLNAQMPLTIEQEGRFRSLLLLRAQREPLQYMLGTQCFYGLDFIVNPCVLIPRQETELLCELAIQAAQGFTAPRILDVCTGSGAIAIVCKRECANACVTATDLSADALSVAAENAKRNEAEVRFLQGDLLAPVSGETFDMILSNPPYIESAACDTLQPEVLREPRMALDGGADGLAFYRRLAVETPPRLAAGGRLMLEVGDTQAATVAQWLTETGSFDNVEVHADLYRKERCVTARRAAFPT